MILLISAAITIDNEEGSSNTFEENLHPYSATDPQAIGGSSMQRALAGDAEVKGYNEKNE